MRKELLQKGKRGMAWLLSVSMLLSSASFTMPVFAQEDLVFIEENTVTGTAEDQIMLAGEGDLIIDDAGDEPGAVISESTVGGGAQITVDAIEDVEITGGESEKETEAETEEEASESETEERDTDGETESTEGQDMNGETEETENQNSSDEPQEFLSEEEFLLEAEEIEALEETRMLLADEAEDGSVQALINAADSDHDAYILIGDEFAQTITENLVIPEEKTVTLDLNGHTIQPDADKKGNGVLNTITVLGRLTLKNSKEGGGLVGTDTVDARGVAVYSGGSFTLESGAVISGFHSSGNGAGVYAEGSGSFIMNGGAITDNEGAEYGGGVFVYDGNKMQLTAGKISGNRAVNGGGVAVLTLSSGTCSLDSADLTIEQNHADAQGGGFYLQCKASEFNLEHTVIKDNDADAQGGGLSFAAAVTCNIKNITISGNSSKRGGGIRLAAGSTVNLLDGCDICGNKASSAGGGLLLDSDNGAKSTFHMSAGRVGENMIDTETNDSTYGAGVYVGAYSNVAISGTALIEGNTAAHYGSGIYINNNSIVEMNGGTILKNINNGVLSGGRGAGISLGSGGRLTIRDGLIQENRSANTDDCGGGIGSYSPVFMEGGQITGNRTANQGGGIYAESTVTISGGTISRNTAWHTGGIRANSITMTGGAVTGNTTSINGGGLQANTVVLKGNAEVSGNAAGTYSGHGGGIYATTVRLEENASVTGNHTETGNGGGIYCTTFTMTGGTVSDNYAFSYGGGVRLGNGTVSAGVITKNRATTNAGGGIYQETAGGTLSLTGTVRIEENTSGNSGGGIYTTGTFSMADGAVTGNIAANYGGGVATGNASVTHKISGGAVYDNTARKINGGQDICISSKADNAPHLILATPADMKDGETITGSSWYDEREKSWTRDAVERDASENALSYTLRYNEVEDSAIAYVDVNNAYYSSVQAAVDALAESGQPGTVRMVKESWESVELMPGFKGTLDLNGYALRGQGSSVIYIPEGAELTIADGSSQHSGLIAQGTGRYSDAQKKYYGGGLYIEGTAVLSGGTIQRNSADAGGGVYVASTGSFTLDGGVISQNSSTGGGGGIYQAGAADLVLKTGTVSANQASGSGGGIFFSGTGGLVMNGGKVTGNTANARGGGVAIDSGTITINDGMILNNTSKNAGGGICQTGTNAVSIIINGGTIGENRSSADSGGGVYISNGLVKVSAGEIKDNLSGSEGGGIYCGATASLTMSGGTISGNLSGSNGGGIRTSGAATNITGGIITGNTAVNGGGIYNTIVLHISKADTVPAVYANDASSMGKDIYSAGSSSELWLLKAEDMAVETHNVWMDETSGIYVEEEIAGPKAGRYCLTAVKRLTNEDPAVARIGDTVYPSIQDAVNAANSGDEIVLLVDQCERVIISNEKEVVIDLDGHTLTADNSNIFYVYGTMTLRDASEAKTGVLTLEEGRTSGRGIFVTGTGSLTIEGGTLTGFQGMTDGGAVYVSKGADFHMTGGAIVGNTAVNGGAVALMASGAASQESTFEIAGGTIAENTAGIGGGVYVTTTNNQMENHIVLSGGTFTKNKTTLKSQGGGAFYFTGTSNKPTDIQLGGVTGRSIVFDGNSAGGLDSFGGALRIINVRRLDIYDGTQIENNTAYRGGGIWCNASTAENCGIFMHGGTIEGNVATLYDGAGAYLSGNITIEGGIIGNNKIRRTSGAYYGGGLWLTGGKITVAGGEFYGNRAPYGGAVCIANGSKVTIGGSVNIHDNAATLTGGGIFLTAATQAVFNGGIVEKNTAVTAGGGIAIGNGTHPAVNLDGIQILNNKVTGTGNDGNGGGVFWGTTAGTLTITGDTRIAGNEAAKGGGIYSAADTNTIKLTGGSVASNTASYGGGIYTDKADIDMQEGQIKGNRATVNGGGIVNTATGVTPGHKHDRITGGEITGNTAGNNGGGIYNSAQCDDLVMSDGICRNNTAVNYGGGIFLSNIDSKFTLRDSGQLYDNTAMMGQDIYAIYDAGNRQDTSALNLLQASEMFQESDEESRIGVGWFDEQLFTLMREQVVLNPVRKIYPLTLQYRKLDCVAMIGNKEYSTVQDAVNAIAEAAENGIMVTDPIVMVDNSRESVTVPGTVTAVLNLNGYKLTGITTAITCYGNLTIEDTEADDNSGDTGTITGNASINGGGILVQSGGSVKMTGGQIVDCRAGLADNLNDTKTNTGKGAGVYCNNGTFELAGGVIRNNCAAIGAAVYAAGGSAVFRMTGGTIEENKTRSGAISIAGGTFSMTGGEIKGNTAFYGGGIYMSSGKLLLQGGSISENTASNNGGGVFVSGGMVTMRDVTVADNTVTQARSANLIEGAGGGIYVSGSKTSVYVYDGTVIRNNTSRRGGGIYAHEGVIRMIGGQITENTADMGGGVAQNPTMRSVFNLAGGMVCGNKSWYTTVGNDIYSGYEGTGNYGTMTVSKPVAVLIPAVSMQNPDYNVWRDDDYSGSETEAETIRDGLYITGKIAESNNLRLTAVSYKEQELEEIHTKMALVKFGLQTKEGKDGTADGTATFDASVKSEEIKASDLLDEGAELSGQFYEENGEEKQLISYEGGLYEQDQAVKWSPGDDSGNNNNIVRTYDTLSYTLYYQVKDPANTDAESDGTDSGQAEEGDDGASNTGDNTEDEPDYKEPEELRLWMEAILPCSASEAEFENFSLDYYYQDEELDAEGNTTQILRGYWTVKHTQGIKATYEQSYNISVKVKEMRNGDTIKPVFRGWVEGSETTGKENYLERSARRATVSAAPRYNVVLKPNTELAYTSCFNTQTGMEASKAEIDGYRVNPDAYPYIKEGTMLGYGITLELYNYKEDLAVDQSMKGIELPKGDITFDLTLSGVMNHNQEEYEAGMPYIWAYKENDSTRYGTNISGTSYNFQMYWNDEDDKPENTTSFAYSAAPYNSGGGTGGCYSGGVWTASEVRDDANQRVTVHFRVSGYSFDGSNGPTAMAGSTDQDSDLSKSYVKAFSAGYIQLIYPVNLEEIEDSGYVEIVMEGAVSGLDLTSLSDSKPSGTENKEPLHEYFGEDYQKFAVCEEDYTDNYRKYTTGLYVFHGDGNSDVIIKNNYFNTGTNGALTGSGGEGNTPINSLVYIGADLSFSSKTFDTVKEYLDDEKTIKNPYYNPDYVPGVDSRIEYNYMTALNLLQKFDADAYTPIGCGPIVDVPSSNLGDSFKNAFLITNTESATSWSDSKTRSYRLTVLYAAKPNGSNWTKDESAQGQKGGEAEMYSYNEEQLIYFETLQDLYDYFGKDDNGDYIGNCVGILYQFRDCCIRNGRSMTVKSKMQVTNEFKKIGGTYCTTNDVRCWSTYRPYYKAAYLNQKLDYRELIYQFNWHDNPWGNVKNGVQAYGLAAAVGSGEKADGYVQDKANYSTVPKEIAPPYIKSEYDENGFKMNGTHNGWYSGNTLLLTTMKGNISIRSTDTVKGGTAAKSEYNISYGERMVRYNVTPSITLHSDATKNPLVQNGSQPTEVTITLRLPEHLNYNEDSVQFDYSKSGYEEHELVWEVSGPAEEEDGGSILTLRAYIPDVNKSLPEINYSCTIGDPSDPENDIAVDYDAQRVGLTTIAEIKTSYPQDQQDQLSGPSSKAEATIQAVIERGNLIYIESPSLVELGADLEYYLNYTNSTDNPEAINLCDVLPYVGDGRHTSFHGGYRLTGLDLIFADEGSYQRYLKEGSLGIASGFNANVADNSTLLAAMKSDAAEKLPENYTRQEESADGYYHVRYDFSNVDQTKFDLTQLSTEGTGIGFYGVIPQIAANENFQIKVTLSPLTEQGTLITDGSAEQTGNDIYMDSFFYEHAGSVGSQKPISSSTTFIRALERTISGVAWMDQNQDGRYTVGSGGYESSDRLLKGIEVSLYSTEPMDNSQAVNVGGGMYYPAVDILGNTVGTAVTNEKGSYVFSRLAEGNYVIVFKDQDGYMVASKPAASAEADYKASVMPFENLSVTPGRDTEAYARPSYATDKAVPYYEEEDSANGLAGLTGAIITNGSGAANGISLPALDEIRVGRYITTNWNCGFYYIDQTLEKQWKNIRIYEDGTNSIPDDVKIKFDITASAEGGNEYKGSYTLTKSGQSVDVVREGIILKPVSAPSESAVVTSSKEDMTVNWKIESIPMQAEGSNGRINYSVQVSETTGTGDPLLGFFMSQKSSMDESSHTVYTAYNEQILYNLDITKISTSIVNGKNPELPGAEFGLFTDEACTKPAKDEDEGQVSGDDGKLAFSNLKAGTYYVKETKAPEGYALNNEVFKIQITYPNSNAPTLPVIDVSLVNGELEDGKVTITSVPEDVVSGGKERLNYTIAFSVADTCLYSLPQSGGIGTLWNTFAGVAIMLTALLLMKRRNWAAAGDDSQAA